MLLWPVTIEHFKAGRTLLGTTVSGSTAQPLPYIWSMVSSVASIQYIKAEMQNLLSFVGNHSRLPRSSTKNGRTGSALSKRITKWHNVIEEEEFDFSMGLFCYSGEGGFNTELLRLKRPFQDNMTIIGRLILSINRDPPRLQPSLQCSLVLLEKLFLLLCLCVLIFRGPNLNKINWKNKKI